MKYRRFFTVVICACISTCFIVFSSSGTDGALNGLKLCYSVIIPSLFPFTVFSLIIYDSGIVNSINRMLSRKNISFNADKAAIFIMSCIGGFPVGARLIENGYTKGRLSKKEAELMLSYCVNSAPSFIITAVGIGFYSSFEIGIVLFSSNLLTNILFAAITSLFKTEKSELSACENSSYCFSELFVKATYDASKAIMNVCAFVILFSSIIGVVSDRLPSGKTTDTILSLLEITNGINIADGNLYFTSFLIGFAGFCVHFQVLSMCRNLKPNYLRFFLLRALHATVSSILTFLIVKLFKISIPTAAVNSADMVFSENSLIFGIAFILLSVAFIASVNQSRNNI